ncbi:DUF4890 domain-containing protein [Algoriphagus namhaensis]
MKKLMMTFGLAMLMTFTLLAQQRGERPTAKERAERMTEKMAEQLQLSEEQKAKILAINLEFAEKREAEKETREANREAMKSEMKEQDERIQAVLTEEQVAKWEEAKAERRERDRGPRRGRRGNG